MKTAQRAAKWWADKLRDGSMLDHGDDSMGGLATRSLGQVLQDTLLGNLSPELVDEFEVALTSIVESMDKYRQRTGFGVDYQPGRALDAAAKAVGLDLRMGMLPWKTYMVIFDDEIKVSCGYGAQLEVI